jgi:hypothetical protein
VTAASAAQPRPNDVAAASDTERQENPGLSPENGGSGQRLAAAASKS